MTQKNNKEFLNDSFLYSANQEFVDEIYAIYCKDPSLVEEHWRDFFAQVDSKNPYHNIAVDNINNARLSRDVAAKNNNVVTPEEVLSEFHKIYITDAYKARGHLLANLDPLGIDIPLTKEQAGLDSNSLKLTPSQFLMAEDFITKLESIYCKSTGVEFSHITNLQEQSWLYKNFEKLQATNILSLEEKIYALENLMTVENFEQTIHNKFPGAKRFSSEGSELAIFALRYLVDNSNIVIADNIILGMAHRGRLATLTCVMGKSFTEVFAGFAGKYNSKEPFSYDVKYHMGFENDYVDKFGRKIKLEMPSNPSHLESVNPVLAGYLRAKQDSSDYPSSILGVLVHGDASFSGQGVVAESLALSKLEPFNTQGIIHLVINNQIGFTANSKDTKTGRYATEVAKMIAAPIIHVNGQDVEAVCSVIKFALQYRAKFAKDIVIDIIAYRKYGHNEGDEPLYTQPVMYNNIRQRSSVAKIFADILQNQKIISIEDYNRLSEQIKTKMQKEYDAVANYEPHGFKQKRAWAKYAKDYTKNYHEEQVVTGVEIDILKQIAQKLFTWPENFAINNKLEKLFYSKQKDIEVGTNIDWATAELLAFGSLLLENTPVRLVGQDAARATFSQRQSVLHDQNNGNKYVPLNHLSPKQVKYFVADSNLSEYAVLGFEYGYSIFSPNNLVIWEAQFGDFANGAQIIIDQYISSAEMKWGQYSGLVMLLPHGYEGQGPEHSSARIERFLQLAAEENIKIYYPST
ncbi:MAG: 2-oxoglutarate dehydrogenase E1 component, partial [Rickettsiaceae bacterium]|nr:2-oxoglutarate dehydrogenase E1 component [Rickettsiaceae bacterium]